MPRSPDSAPEVPPARLAEATSGALISCVDAERLTATAADLVAISSPTGAEQECAEYLTDVLKGLDLVVAHQEVEEGRPNVIGTLPGDGGGRCVMFNGHMDTSYSGRESYLSGAGFRPEATIRDGRIYGLGISNMKGALACYIEAVRAIRDARLALRGDLIVAAVCGEIETAQWSDEFRGARYRGYGTGSRALPIAGVLADVCILGEATEGRVVLGHFGSMWARISTAGPFMHTAWTEGRIKENSIVRMQDVLPAVLSWVDEWTEHGRYEGVAGVVNLGAIRGGFPWRVSRTPGRTNLFLDIRVPPSMPMQSARAAFDALVRELRGRFPDYGIASEIYLSAPGSRLAAEHPLVDVIEDSHATVFGEHPERDVVRWFCDASALSRYGIDTIVYGTSSGLPGPGGESLEISGLADMARSYALAAARLCEPV